MIYIVFHTILYQNEPSTTKMLEAHTDRNTAIKRVDELANGFAKLYDIQVTTELGIRWVKHYTHRNEGIGFYVDEVELIEP